MRIRKAQKGNTMKRAIERVNVFAQYGVDGFVRYEVHYNTGTKRVYWIHSHYKTKGWRKVPKTVFNFIHDADFAYGEDRTLFMHNGLPCGFTEYEYCNCPF